MAKQTADLESHLDQAVARYEQLAEENSSITLDDLVQEFPGCEAELREHARLRDVVEGICSPLKRVVHAASVPPKIEGYENLVEIGRGGMGIIYEAKQLSTQRTVAVKVIRPERLASLGPQARAELIDRFRIEPIATMDHPNIVRVYHAACGGDHPYLIMELVRGATLRERIRSADGTIADVLGWLEQAARGIHHAHRHGVLHRDLKPANIMIESDSGTAKVADFGLAKLDQPVVSNSQASVAWTGDLVGTLAYMSPEQLDDSDDVTIASDVYGLSATLYECLAGRPPFQGSSLEMRQAIENEPPTPLRQLNPDVPRALERICSRGLAKDPARRFATAEQFADELRQLREVPGGNAAVYFASMGWPLLVFGVLCLAVHVGIFFLLRFGIGEPWIWLAMLSTYVPLFAIFWTNDSHEFPSKKAAGRQLWSLWIGHAVLVSLAIVSVRAQIAEISTALAVVYPILSACTATILMIMAATFWRYHLVLAFVWLGVALANVATPGWAPLEFGIAAAFSSLVIGLYEVRLIDSRLVDAPLAPAATPSCEPLPSPSLLFRQSRFDVSRAERSK